MTEYDRQGGERHGHGKKSTRLLQRWGVHASLYLSMLCGVKYFADTSATL
jgi:hypothetical protein